MKPLSIKEIRDYINRNYPDSDAVERYYNCRNKVLEEDAALREMFLDDCKDCFWSEELHWCGCGDTDKAATAIRDYLIACWRWIDLCNKPHPKNLLENILIVIMFSRIDYSYVLLMLWMRQSLQNTEPA